MVVTCECGCGTPVNMATGNNRRLALRKGDYYRFVNGHRQVWLNWVEDENGCWIWTGTLNSSGYGSHAKTYRYYRSEVPGGMELDHLCRVRHCVNPWHLEAVTRGENHRRKPIRCGHPIQRQTKDTRGCRVCKDCKARSARALRARRRAAA